MHLEFSQTKQEMKSDWYTSFKHDYEILDNKHNSPKSNFEKACIFQQ